MHWRDDALTSLLAGSLQLVWLSYLADLYNSAVHAWLTLLMLTASRSRRRVFCLTASSTLGLS